MKTWLDFGASNALAGTVLALFAWIVSRACGRPQVVFAVWVLVLAKLVTPPLVALPVESLRGYLTWTPAIAPSETTELPLSELLESDELPSHLRLPSEPVASAAIADPMESLDGSLMLDEIAPLEESVAASPFDEIQFIQYRLPDPVSGDEITPVAAESFTKTHVLLAAWLIGSSLWFALAVARIMRFRRLLKLARPAAPDLEAEVRALAGRMQLRQVPEVRVVRRRVSPLVWALGGRATLLLPSDLLRRLTREERATLLAHELAHLKRRDHLVRLLELAALGLFWWHPVAWWARRNAERAAEHCCDAQVIELFPAQARAYALALWTTIDFLSDAPEALPLGASGFSQARHVKRRMEMILASTRVRRAGRPLRFVLLAIGLAVLPLSLRSLWAEPPAPAATQKEEVETTLGGEEAASEAGLIGTVEIEEKQGDPDKDASDPVADVIARAVPDGKPLRQAIAFLVNAQATEEPSPKPAPKTSSIEERLDRLEKMIQALAERRPGPAAYAQPLGINTHPELLGIQTTPKPRAKEEKPRPEKAVVDVPADGVTYFEIKDGIKYQKIRQGEAKSPDDESAFLKNIENDSDMESDANRRLAEVLREATMHLELSKTNLARFEAAKRQAEAVKKAYEAETVDLDQLLKAQRRVVEAYLLYVRATAELEPKAPERLLIITRAGLAATNRALNDARDTWKKIHVAYVDGGDSRKEAQAREHYYQLKQQTQTLLKEYRLAEAEFKHRAPGWDWGGVANAEGTKDLADTKARHKRAGEAVDTLAQDKLKMAADAMMLRTAEAEKIQARARLEIERAHREAAEARWKLEGLERHVRLREQEAQTAVKTAEAAGKQLEALKAAQDAAKESTKSEAPK